MYFLLLLLGKNIVILGEAEKAMYHYKQAGAESDPDVLTKAKNLQSERSNDMFCDDIFGESPAGVRKTVVLRE
ncbi:unnamed protein product [Camellia sinensis]